MIPQITTRLVQDLMQDPAYHNALRRSASQIKQKGDFHDKYQWNT